MRKHTSPKLVLGFVQGAVVCSSHLLAVTASQITVPQISKSLNHRDQCTLERTNSAVAMKER